MYVCCINNLKNVSFMNKQDYETELVFLKTRRREITERMDQILKEYISTNEPFKIGDRVKTVHGEIGLVYGFGLDWDGNVKPLMYKEKKDGAKSKFKLDVFLAEQVSLADIF